jgi:hypothetical protein
LPPELINHSNNSYGFKNNHDEWISTIKLDLVPGMSVNYLIKTNTIQIIGLNQKAFQLDYPSFIFFPEVCFALFALQRFTKV